MFRDCLWFALAVVAMAACKSEGEDARECNVNADCASKVCLSNGTCQRYTPPIDGGGDGEPTDANSVDASLPDVSSVDAADEVPEPEAGQDASSCPNQGDWVVTRDELVAGPAQVATYRVNNDGTSWSTSPDCTAVPCAWNLVDAPGSSQDVQVVPAAPSTYWFGAEPEFASATYVSPMGEATVGVCSYTQMGVYQLTDQALLLIGIASLEEDLAHKTKLTYDTPVTILQLPLQASLTWQQNTHARGSICSSALEYDIEQNWDMRVDAFGEATVPAGTFKVLRVNTLMQRVAGVGVTSATFRTHLLVGECMPWVARISAPEGTDSLEFSAFSELWRLQSTP